jgi:hypothetical protein
VGSPEPLSRLEVAAPQWVERVSVRLHLHVAPDGDIGGVNQPNLIRARTLRVREQPVQRSTTCVAQTVPVPMYDPGRDLFGCLRASPIARASARGHSHFPIRRTCFDVAVIVCPTTDDRVEQPDQILLFRGAIRANLSRTFSKKACMFFLEGCNQELAAILTQVLPQEVEALFDMRDAGFLR